VLKRSKADLEMRGTVNRKRKLATIATIAIVT